MYVSKYVCIYVCMYVYMYSLPDFFFFLEQAARGASGSSGAAAGDASGDGVSLIYTYTQTIDKYIGIGI